MAWRVAEGLETRTAYGSECAPRGGGASAWKEATRGLPIAHALLAGLGTHRRHVPNSPSTSTVGGVCGFGRHIDPQFRTHRSGYTAIADFAVYKAPKSANVLRRHRACPIGDILERIPPPVRPTPTRASSGHESGGLARLGGYLDEMVFHPVIECAGRSRARLGPLNLPISSIAPAAIRRSIQHTHAGSRSGPDSTAGTSPRVPRSPHCRSPRREECPRGGDACLRR